VVVKDNKDINIKKKIYYWVYTEKTNSSVNNERFDKYEKLSDALSNAKKTHNNLSEHSKKHTRITMFHAPIANERFSKFPDFEQASRPYWDSKKIEEIDKIMEDTIKDDGKNRKKKSITEFLREERKRNPRKKVDPKKFAPKPKRRSPLEWIRTSELAVIVIGVPVAIAVLIFYYFAYVIVPIILLVGGFAIGMFKGLMKD